jgi:hypothetical protein
MTTLDRSTAISAGLRRLTLGLLVTALVLLGSIRLASAQTTASAAPTWNVSLSGADPGAAIYPGHGRASIDFTATSSGAKPLAQLRAAISTDEATGEARDRAGRVIHGCLARWFRVLARPDSPRPTSLPGSGESYRGRLVLTMIDAPVNQDACQGAQLGLRLSAT